MIADCANSNQASTSNSQLDKITFGTNWLTQAEHGGFYQAISYARRLRHRHGNLPRPRTRA